MQTGIIGLPRVGKTSLFKILTHAHLDAQAARAATHIGVARVPDARLERLTELYKPRKVTHASVEYIDIGGLAQDRAKDSVFLTQLREADALAHVVRVFEDPAVPPASGKIDSLGDVQSLELELMLTDLDQAGRRIERIEKDLKKKADPALERELALLTRCRAAIEGERPLRELDFNAEERKVLSSFMFLCEKPMLYVLNLGDNEVGEIESAVERHKLGALAARPNTAVVPICGRIEAELVDLRSEEHTSELQSPCNLVCRLLLEKKKNQSLNNMPIYLDTTSHPNDVFPLTFADGKDVIPHTNAPACGDIHLTSPQDYKHVRYGVP